MVRAPMRKSFVAGHLYVSAGGINNPPSTAPVMRYRLTNGVPMSQPDLVYPNSLLPYFSVDDDGTLYGIELYPFSIVVFPPNTTTPARQIAPFQPYLTNYTGITGHNGYIYAAYVYSSSLRTRRAGGATPPSFCSAYGVVVFGPHARGHHPWRTCFAASYATGGPVWMSLDPQGNLYMPTWPPGVAVYANPATNPKLVRTMSGSSFQNMLSVTDDGQDQLYVPGSLRPPTGLAHSYVASYDDGGNGNVKPLRVVAYVKPQAWNGNVAVDDRYLYIGGNQQVLVYDKLANGPQLPLATLAVPAATQGRPSVAVGP
jgi:hypothetical protein